MKKPIIILLCVAVTSHVAWGQDSIQHVDGKKPNFRKEMRAGNKWYDASNPVEAETSYRKALEADNNSNEAAFNLGDALYRQEKYDKAAEQFEIAANGMTEKIEKAKAYHNTGNSYVQQQKLKEGINAYKQALRNNPDDMDTKTNLSYALKLLQQQQQQQQNQQNDNDKNQDKKDDQEQDKDQQNQQNQDQQQKQDQQQQQQQQQQQISQEDAQRMLDAIAQEEKELQEKLKKKEKAGYRPQIEKNW
ncbi:MAG: tetratricopeptide repeat protein [Bacteroidales bacterium]|jgi:tetratricopeptide (TPR) repeat protein|nr:tetratricopeptide repeat protein [Bacteroidales bacterium]